MGDDIRLSAVYITYQCNKLDYCLDATIRASLDLCDDVWVNDGRSTDGTLDILKSLENEYGKDRLKIIEKDWKHNRAFWAEERNYLFSLIPDKNFVLNLGADEIIHEMYFPKIRASLTNLKNKLTYQFYVKHFYGTPNYTISGPRWSRVLTKIWRNDTNIKYYNRPGGCADDPLWPNGAPVHFVSCANNGSYVYHYGHCRHPKAVAMKNVKADSLYRGESKYSDGSFPEIRSYDYRLEEFLKNGGAKKFEGTHPKYIKEWVDLHKNQTTFWREKV